MSPEVQIEVGKKQYLADGSSIESNEKNPRKKLAGNTSRHESVHTVIALFTGTHINRVSIRPGPGYLGITEPTEFNAPAALGPHALGMDGTGHDVYIAEVFGADMMAASSVAKTIASEKSEHIEALGSALEDQLEMNERDVLEVFDEVDHGKIIDITTRRPDGKVEKTEVRAKGTIFEFTPRKKYEIAA